jgi:hypothetical protein
MLAHMLMGDWAAAEQVVDEARSADGIPENLPLALDCARRAFELEQLRAWNEIYQLRDGECMEDVHPTSYINTVVHRAASQLGDWDTAKAIEGGVTKALEEARSEGASHMFDTLTPTLLHMQGVRQALSGDLAAAEKSFRDADAHLTYRESGLGMFKLYNRMFLVETYLAQGRDAEAHKLLAKVRAVNPVIVSDFEENGFQLMGLSRG